MTVAEYIIVASVAFQLPVHPGLVPVHAARANAATCQENIPLYNSIIKELNISMTVQDEIKKQLLTAVDQLYLAKMDNNTYGFVDITIAAIHSSLHQLWPHHTCQIRKQLCQHCNHLDTGQSHQALVGATA